MSGKRDQQELTAEEQDLINHEQAALQEATRAAEAQYLANRVAHLTVENSRLRSEVMSLKAARNSGAKSAKKSGAKRPKA